jgi:hypothetical protein
MKDEILVWLRSEHAIDEELGEDSYFISFGDDWGGPTELALYSDGSWELSFESRLDKADHKGYTLTGLKRVINRYRQ